jgi:hypothetical protein
MRVVDLLYGFDALHEQGKLFELVHWLYTVVTGRSTTSLC